MTVAIFTQALKINLEVVSLWLPFIFFSELWLKCSPPAGSSVFTTDVKRKLISPSVSPYSPHPTALRDVNSMCQVMRLHLCDARTLPFSDPSDSSCPKFTTKNSHHAAFSHCQSWKFRRSSCVVRILISQCVAFSLLQWKRRIFCVPFNQSLKKLLFKK